MRPLRGRRALFSVATALVFLAGCRAFLDLEDGTEQPDAAVPDVDASQPDTAQADTGPATVACPIYEVTEGVYPYEDENFAVPSREKLIQLQSGVHKDGGAVIDKQSPANFFATSRKGDGGAPIFRLDLNDQHFDEYTFAPPTADGGLRVVRFIESLIGNAVNVSCDPPVEAIRCPMVPDTTWQAAATGLFGTTKFDAKLEFHYVAEEPIAIQGKLIDTYHVVEKRMLSGAISGEGTVEYWYAKDNGLLIKGKIIVGDITSKVVDGMTMVTAFGPFEYKARMEFKIKSLTPTPLDAGISDAKSDG